MKNYSKEIPEVAPMPKTDQENPIPLDYIPEPKKQEVIPIPEKEEDANNSQT